MLWFSKVRECLIDHLGYTQLRSELTVSWKYHKDRNMGVILAYVDDLIFISSSKSLFRDEVSRFLDIFEGTEESLECYLGVDIVMTQDTLVFSQKTYFKKLLDQFDLTHCKAYTTPMVSDFYDDVKRELWKKIVILRSIYEDQML